MKKMVMFAVVSLALVAGCGSSQYSTVKTGPNRFSLSGPDPNKVQGNAFQACKDEGFDDYSVVASDKNGITVKCEKEGRPFLDRAGEVYGEVKEAVKRKVEELRK